jgi:hypothetical protein
MAPAHSSNVPAQTRAADITLVAFIVATLRVNMVFSGGLLLVGKFSLL